MSLVEVSTQAVEEGLDAIEKLAYLAHQSSKDPDDADHFTGFLVALLMGYDVMGEEGSIEACVKGSNRSKLEKSKR